MIRVNQLSTREVVLYPEILSTLCSQAETRNGNQVEEGRRREDKETRKSLSNHDEN